MRNRNSLLAYIFLFALLLTASYGFYHSSISHFPAFIHSWTQTDRYALALCYLTNGMNLFTPCTYNLMTVKGITAVDLPFFEYLIAWIMKLSGDESPLVFRSSVLAFSLIGHLFLFKLSKIFRVPTYWGIMLVFFSFSSPVLAYYQAGFIPSPISLSLIYIGWFYYFKYLHFRQYKQLYTGVLFLLIAAIYRTPFNIFLFASLLVLATERIRSKKAVVHEIVTYATAYILLISHAIYKHHMAEKYGSMFLGSILPPTDIAETQFLLADIWRTWKLDYLTIYHYIFIALAIIPILWRMRQKSGLTSRKLALYTFFILGGATIYSLLMLKQFPAHDYYFIDSFLPGLVLLSLLGFANINVTKKWFRISITALGGILLFLGYLSSIEIQRNRYTFHGWDRATITSQNFSGADDFLDSLGIDREEPILILDSYSTNGPLILCGRKGYTVQYTTRENIDSALNHYSFGPIIIQDQFLLSDVIYNYPELTNHLQPIGHNGKISVFNFSPSFIEQSNRQLLGLNQIASSFFEWNNLADSTFWDIHQLQPLGTEQVLISSSDYYGPVFHQAAAKFAGHRLIVEADLISDKIADIEINVNISSSEGTSYYFTFPFRLSISETHFESLFYLPESIPENSELRCHIINPYSHSFSVEKLKLSFYDE